MTTTILHPGDYILDEHGEAQRVVAPDLGIVFDLTHGHALEGFSFEEDDFVSARAAFYRQFAAGARVVEFDEDTGRYHVWSRS